ncbi:MAG: hypothetical protein K2H52_01360 [Lachnospiraceae bacterium]|nr:hypothetical protein [Lachnospiraceae bacterium]
MLLHYDTRPPGIDYSLIFTMNFSPMHIVFLFKLPYTHLEEREFHNVCQNLKRDEEYPETSMQETE